MNNPSTTLTKSLEILHSSLFFLAATIILYMLYISTPWFILSLPLIALKIFLFAGMYGAIVDLASQKILALSFKNFYENARKFWWIYFLLTIVQFAVNNQSSSYISQLGIKQKIEPFYFDIVVLFIMASVTIFYKFIRPLKLKIRTPKLTVKHLVAILFLYFLNALIRNYYWILPFEISPFDNLPILASTYTHLFLYCYIVIIFMETYPEIEKSHEHEKEIYLINPVSSGILIGLISGWYRAYPPAFVVLKALSPKYYKFKEFIRLPWKNRFYRSNKLVAITCFTSNSPEAYKIAKEFKKRGSTVVMGGPHVTYLPEEALAFCDAVVIGEAEDVWPQVINDYENNSLKKKYMGSAIEGFHIKVHNELLQSPPEVIKEFLETTRGCKYRCHFCTIPSLSGGRARQKPVEEIVELIEKIKSRHRVVTFIDNNIYSNPGYAKELFTALKPLKIQWATQCTIDIAKNDETLKLAHESGCRQFLFGYEIFGGSLEKEQGGKFALADKYISFTQKIKNIGIKVKAHFIFGFDSDGLLNALKMWKFCFSIRPLFTVISLLTPLPGSRVYYDMLKENRITNYNWRYYDCQHLVYTPQKLSSVSLKFLFPMLKYTCFFTTCEVGQIALLILILDYIFFGLVHL